MKGYLYTSNLISFNPPKKKSAKILHFTMCLEAKIGFVEVHLPKESIQDFFKNSTQRFHPMSLVPSRVFCFGKSVWLLPTLSCWSYGELVKLLLSKRLKFTINRYKVMLKQVAKPSRKVLVLLCKFENISIINFVRNLLHLQ